MALIKVKSHLTGEVNFVPESAYNNYLKPTNLYTVIEEAKEPVKATKQEQPKVERVAEPVAEEKKIAPIKPIKPIKPKADYSDINEEI